MADAAKQLAEFLYAHLSLSWAIAGSLLTLLGGALGAGWAASSFLNKREIEDYKRQIEQLKVEHQRDLTNVAREAEAGAVLDEKFPSIGQLEPTDFPMGLAKAEYHKAFNIVLTQRTEHWSFQTSSLVEIFSSWFGSGLTTNEHLSEGYSLIGGDEEREQCLLWKGSTEVLVENSDVLKKMYPFVIVRLIRHEAGADPTTDELFNFVHWLQMWDKAMPNARFEIIKMHRTPNKAYLRGYYRFAGLEIAENPLRPARKYDEYFLMRQIFAYRSDTYTTIISTGLPNRGLVSDPYYAWLKGWWEALRLVKGFRP